MRCSCCIAPRILQQTLLFNTDLRVCMFRRHAGVHIARVRVKGRHCPWIGSLFQLKDGRTARWSPPQSSHQIPLFGCVGTDEVVALIQMVHARQIIPLEARERSVPIPRPLVMLPPDVVGKSSSAKWLVSQTSHPDGTQVSVVSQEQVSQVLLQPA
jgi:hypothetical protein